LASMGTSLVYVTHHTSELVDSVSHVTFVDKGRLAFQGTTEEFRLWDQKSQHPIRQEI
jgi:ABC-type multidrug transport system ATPase subunit